MGGEEWVFMGLQPFVVEIEGTPSVEASMKTLCNQMRVQ